MGSVCYIFTYFGFCCRSVFNWNVSGCVWFPQSLQSWFALGHNCLITCDILIICNYIAIYPVCQISPYAFTSRGVPKLRVAALHRNALKVYPNLGHSSDSTLNLSTDQWKQCLQDW